MKSSSVANLITYFSPPEESCSDPVRRMSRFDLLTKLLALEASLGEVGVNFTLVLQIVANHYVNIGQREHVVLLDDFFRGGTLIESSEHRIEGNTRVSNTQHSSCIGAQWHRFSLNRNSHVYIVALSIQEPEVQLFNAVYVFNS